MARYVSIWFPYLLAEHRARKKPELQSGPFVLAARRRGRHLVEAVNHHASKNGLRAGMVLADCKAIFPELTVLESGPPGPELLLQAMAEWSIRYTPVAATDFPDGLVLDASGCAHLWGGESAYLRAIQRQFYDYGYTAKIAMADTIGTAWALARFGPPRSISAPKIQRGVLCNLPPEGLRLEPPVLAKLRKLGLHRIGDFMQMPAVSLRRRFGPDLPRRLAQALGQEAEFLRPVKPVLPWQERLNSMEPIVSAKGIGIAIQRLLETLCLRLQSEGMGLRKAVLKVWRVDGEMQQIAIGTHRPSRHVSHLFKLFEHKIPMLQPGLGFETFLLEASVVEPFVQEQAAIWTASSQSDAQIGELLDRIQSRVGPKAIARYLPAAHHWPERAVKQAVPLWEEPAMLWRTDLPRPVHLLDRPEPIEVTAVLPDYPPMMFRYKGKVHEIVKSDGPERIEQEWWLSRGTYRDYYGVEDQTGARFWVFRSEPYEAGTCQWFLHGFFA